MKDNLTNPAAPTFTHSNVAAEGGPATAVAPRKAFQHDMARFNVLMAGLSHWRSEDHEDATALSRNQIIEIVEGVEELRRQVAYWMKQTPGRPVPHHGSGGGTVPMSQRLR